MEKFKICFKCGKNKPLSAFYIHSKMADGYLGKCKSCTKKDTKDRTSELTKNPEWYEQEKARHREKYYRLGYKEKHKSTSGQRKITMDKYNSKYPEKKLARNKTQNMKPKVEGNELHHWSYNPEHYKDVIELMPKNHAEIHRYIIYDQERMMYRVAKTGVLLNTKLLHMEYINSII